MKHFYHKTWWDSLKLMHEIFSSWNYTEGMTGFHIQVFFLFLRQYIQVIFLVGRLQIFNKYN